MVIVCNDMQELRREPHTNRFEADFAACRFTAGELSLKVAPGRFVTIDSAWNSAFDSARRAGFDQRDAILFDSRAALALALCAARDFRILVGKPDLKSRPHAPSVPMRSAPAYFLCKWGV
jgi:hypothetical protein